MVMCVWYHCPVVRGWGRTISHLDFSHNWWYFNLYILFLLLLFSLNIKQLKKIYLCLLFIHGNWKTQSQWLDWSCKQLEFNKTSAEPIVFARNHTRWWHCRRWNTLKRRKIKQNDGPIWWKRCWKTQKRCTSIQYGRDGEQASVACC